MIGVPVASPDPASIIGHRAILFTLNRLYRDGISSEELYEATRGIWKAGERRNGAQYAMAVYRGTIREVYEIDRWYPAGSTPYRFRVFTTNETDGRWEFTGTIAANVRGQYVGKNVGPGGQNPIRYVNC